MKKYLLKTIFYMCFVLLFAGCGYQLASNMPTVLGERTVTLKVRSVEHPTLYPWMSYKIRSSLRDQINEKNIARWVDSGPAEYEIDIRVLSYQRNDWMTDEDKVGILYDQSITMEATIYKGAEKNVFWRSGEIFYSLRSEKLEEEQNSSDIIKEIMIRLTDKMQNAF